MTDARRVLHLTGSPVSAFWADLSLTYARDCLQAVVDPARYAPQLAYVAPGGAWHFPVDLGRAALAAAPPLSAAAALARIAELAPDVMVPQLFCRPGMTHYRALFDMLGIPYLGNPPDVMALTAHKARARAVVAAAGVDVPSGETLQPGQVPTLELPLVVKPVDADNSLGVTLVREPGELDEALRDAFAHADEVLVERYVELGREVRCGILERDGELVCLPLEEYALDRVRTASDKLARGADGELGLVAKGAGRAWIVDRDDPVTEAAWAVARRCHVALGCRHYSLFDLRVDPDGRPWFLEASLYCSFARQSVLAVMAAATGITAAELFAQTLTESENHHAR